MTRTKVFFKKMLVVVLLIGFFPVNAQANSNEYVLVWSDEYEIPGFLNPDYWVYEEGYGIRNSESQCYDRKNVRVENGFLIIEARKEDGCGGAEYTSGSINTRNLYSIKFGRIEFRASLPFGEGFWPGLWTTGIGKWPEKGEFDIMENVGWDPHTIHGTIHYQEDGHHIAVGENTYLEDPHDFHIYAIEWTEERIDFFVDDRKYWSFDIKAAGHPEGNPFLTEHILRINLALGGTWGGAIDDSALPQKYRIDYVRVYKKKQNNADIMKKMIPVLGLLLKNDE